MKVFLGMSSLLKSRLADHMSGSARQRAAGLVRDASEKSSTMLQTKTSPLNAPLSAIAVTGPRGEKVDDVEKPAEHQTLLTGWQICERTNRRKTRRQTQAVTKECPFQMLRLNEAAVARPSRFSGLAMHGASRIVSSVLLTCRALALCIFEAAVNQFRRQFKVRFIPAVCGRVVGLVIAPRCRQAIRHIAVMILAA
jgi:hypothetical protein